MVEVTRGPMVESVHRGSGVVVDSRARVVRFWGDMNKAVYPRSAVKPLQAVPLIRSGAARALGLDAEEIALACASHNGEPEHVEAVDRWLSRLGYGPQQLECGAHPPADPQARHELVRQDRSASPLHNNCSGKHAGFLSICRHLGFAPEGYIRPDHPVQELVRAALAELTGCNLAEAPCGIDGCGIPVYGIPLRGLATAMMKFAGSDVLEDETAAAVHAIRDAMTAHPYLVAGRDRFCTATMQALAPNVLVKAGAEGTCCAAVMDQGVGIALKIDDGGFRASEVAMGGILRCLGVIDDSRFAALRSKLEPDVLNVAGIKVGVIKAAPVLVHES